MYCNNDLDNSSLSIDHCLRLQLHIIVVPALESKLISIWYFDNDIVNSSPTIDHCNKNSNYCYPGQE